MRCVTSLSLSFLIWKMGIMYDSFDIGDSEFLILNFTGIRSVSKRAFKSHNFF